MGIYRADINFKEQLTDELKNKWYYQQIAWGLKVNKNSVKFDDGWTFKVNHTTYDFEGEKEGLSELVVYLNGEKWKILAMYWGDNYSDDPQDALKDICVYIANYI